jgi:hypothetical protein
MIWGVLAGAVVALAALGVWFAPMLSRGVGRGPRVEAERPCSFGFRMAWVAVRTRDTARLINVLGLSPVRASGWSGGVAAVYADKDGLARVFVTPPVEGWSFIVSLGLPLPMGDAYVDKASRLIECLSEAFGPVGYFVSFPALDFYGWAWAQEGRIRRAFAVGREGAVWNRGAVTIDERLIAPAFFSLSEVGQDKTAAGVTMPGQAVGAAGHPFAEADVLRLARAWSVDPSAFDGRGDLDRGIGYLAAVPKDWDAVLDVDRAA